MHLSGPRQQTERKEGGGPPEHGFELRRHGGRVHLRTRTGKRHRSGAEHGESDQTTEPDAQAGVRRTAGSASASVPQCARTAEA